MKSPDAVRLVVLLGPRFLDGLPPNLLLVLPLLDVLHLLLPLFRLLPHPPCVQPDLPVSLRSENKFMFFEKFAHMHFALMYFSADVLAHNKLLSHNIYFKNGQNKTPMFKTSKLFFYDL